MNRLKSLGILFLTIQSTLAFAQKAAWDTVALNTAAGATYLTDAEKRVILLVNEVRSNPGKFADEYLASKRSESKEAEECYQVLRRAAPVQPLKPSKALHLAARDHAQDMGSKGKVGHVGTDGEDPAARVKRYGVFTGPYTGPWENCSYGYNDPLDIVLQLLIDEGVPSRGHRKNIMEKAVNFIGVSIEPHTTYRYNCVMDFADSIEDK